MSSGKRQPSKNKRASQNRNQRQALQARKAAASAPAGGGSTRSSSSGGSGGLLGRLRGGGSTSAPASRTRATGTRPATDRPSGGLGAARADQPIGYRAALAGLLAAGAAVVLSFFVSTPVNQDGDFYTSERVVAEWSDTAVQAAVAAPDADAGEVRDSIDEWMPHRDSERMVIALFPASLAMALPVLGAFLAFRAVKDGRSSKVVNRAMYATLLGALLTISLFTFFLPTVVAVSIAGFQVRKAEVAAAQAAAAEAGGDADVIDADVVEADVAESEVVDDEPVDEDDVEPVDEDDVDRP